MAKKEIYLHERYPLTELLRIINKAIENGDDEFQIIAEQYYQDTNYYIETQPKE